MDIDKHVFERDVDETLKKGSDAFKGKYKNELNALLGLSKEDIDKIAPGPTSLQKYDELIVVVKEASAKNVMQTLLKERIIGLGEVAIKITRCVPELAPLGVEIHNMPKEMALPGNPTSEADMPGDITSKPEMPDDPTSEADV